MIEMNFNLSTFLSWLLLLMAVICFCIGDYDATRFFFIIGGIFRVQCKLEEIEKRLNDLSKK